MHHQHRVACRQKRKPCPRAIDLIDKAFAAGRPVARRRFPEFVIGGAELGGEFVMAPSGPCAEILFAKGRLFDRVENKRERGLPCPARRAADGQRARRQSGFQCGKGSHVAEIGRRVRAMDDAARPVDRRMADQAQTGLRAHGCASLAASRTRIAVSLTCSAPPKRRRSGRRFAASPAAPCRTRSNPPQAQRTARWSTTATTAR